MLYLVIKTNLAIKHHILTDIRTLRLHLRRQLAFKWVDYKMSGQYHHCLHTTLITSSITSFQFCWCWCWCCWFCWWWWCRCWWREGRAGGAAVSAVSQSVWATQPVHVTPHTQTLQCSFKTVIYDKYTSYIYISYTDFNTSDRTAVWFCWSFSVIEVTSFVVDIRD